jgi:predicted NUDIX family NTP pyrophosphohydrolase
MVIPEVDRVEWFGVEEARRRAHPAQAQLVERLEVALGTAGLDATGAENAG